VDNIDLTVSTVPGQEEASFEHFHSGTSNIYYRIEMENGTVDLPEQDTDGDGITDYYETGSHGDITNSVFDVQDSDGDGITDGYEIFVGLDPSDATDAVLDPDGDGLSHFDEFLGFDGQPAQFDYSQIQTTVFLGDWTFSWIEDKWTAPSYGVQKALTPDGQPDGYDTDLDGMDDGWEVTYGLNANMPSHITGTDITISGNVISSTTTDLTFFSKGDWLTVSVDGGSINEGHYEIDSSIDPGANLIILSDSFSTTDGPGVEITLRHDIDNDGLSDLEEYLGEDGIKPTFNMSNGNLLTNGAYFGWDFNNDGKVDADTGENLVALEDHTNPTVFDTDNDTFGDGRERSGLLGGSDPTDPESILLRLTGRITTTSPTPADMIIRIEEFSNPASTTPNFVSINGVYTVSDLPTGDYKIYAWEDSIANGILDPATEFYGILGNSAPGIQLSGGSPNIVLDFDLSSTPSLRSVAPTFAEWSTIESIPPGLSGPLADADADGVSNFLEYIANTNPNDSAHKPNNFLFQMEDTLSGLIPQQNPGFRTIKVIHPWNEVLSEKVKFEIQTTTDLNQGWTTRKLGDGILQSLRIEGDQIEAIILSHESDDSIFTRFVFSEIE
jgi:hypothetical protein